jgi:hypothetical protein
VVISGCGLKSKQIRLVWTQGSGPLGLPSALQVSVVSGEGRRKGRLVSEYMLTARGWGGDFEEGRRA